MDWILPLVVQIAIRMISYVFEKGYLNEVQKQAFLNFIQAMNSQGNTSERARSTYQDLHERLKNKTNLD